MEPYFRIATDTDVDLLLRMMREYYAFDHHPFDPEKARAALTSLLRGAELGRVWLVWAEETFFIRWRDYLQLFAPPVFWYSACAPLMTMGMHSVAGCVSFANL
jgi:hypothetical protein